MPLHTDFSSLGLRIERDILAVEAVCGNATGCAPCAVLKYGDIVRADRELISLSKANFYHVSNYADCFGVDTGKNRGNDFLIDALQNFEEVRVLVEAHALTLEILKGFGGGCTGSFTCLLSRIEKMVDLELLIGLCILLLSDHGRSTNTVGLQSCSNSRLTTTGMFISKQTASSNNICAITAQICGFGAVDFKHARRESIKRKSFHCVILLVNSDYAETFFAITST